VILEVRSSFEATPQQDPRRADRAGGHDDKVCLDLFTVDRRTDSALAVEQDPLGVCVRPDGQIGTCPRWLELCERGVPAHAVSDVERARHDL
jgi:hypothetical protein